MAIRDQRDDVVVNTAREATGLWDIHRAEEPTGCNHPTNTRHRQTPKIHAQIAAWPKRKLEAEYDEAPMTYEI